MTQADKYFAKDGRYTERIIDLVIELKNSPREDSPNIIRRFLDNTKLHIAGMKLEESDVQYVKLCTAEHILEVLRAITA